MSASSIRFQLRPHQVGDIGWVIQRHGELYGREYGYGIKFELMVARLLVEFGNTYNPQRERLWIAERAGERMGSIACFQAEEANVAQLRLFLVEPEARGLGLGRALVAECIDFASECGYRSMRLLTVSGLSAAAHIYRRAGFKQVDEFPYNEWDMDMVGQIYERGLGS